MCIIWGNAPNTNIDAVEKVVRRAGRFVLGYNKYDSVKLDITTKLNWLFPEFLYKYDVLKLTYTIFNNTCPNYFNNYIDFSKINTICTRTTNHVNPSIMGNTAIYKRSFLHFYQFIAMV